MNVQRNLSYQASDGGYRKIAVGLVWDDLLQLVEEKRVEGYQLAEAETMHGVAIVNDAGEKISVVAAYRIMQAACDLLAWSQLASEGAASVEFAKEKMDAARARAPQLRL